MSFEIVVGGEQRFAFATNGGMADFGRWTDSLDVEQSPLLSHLMDHGWVDDLPGLAAECDALQADDPDVQSVLDGLRAALQQRDEGAESIMLTDGMGPDDGQPEEVASEDQS